jgi:peptidyl-tRNA hydrolase, PTH1 family
MKLLVGLGNNGAKYARTRHNLGFMVLDALVDQQGWAKPQPDSKLQGSVSKDSFGAPEEGIVLLKPATMMNLSGRSIAAAAHYYQIPAEDVWVIYDDIDLEFGTLRVRQGGGSGGHNGLKSIIQHIGPDFGRIRLGVSNELRESADTAHFVLAQFTTDEQQQLPKVISAAATVISEHLEVGTLTVQTYNLLEGNNPSS